MQTTTQTPRVSFPRPVIWLLDFVELVVPAVSFMVLFIVFNAQIFARYVLHSPLSWSTEVCQLAFVWTAILGASYMRRKSGHIAFDMVFEQFSPRNRQLAIIAGNLIVGGACAGSILPTIDYLDFLRGEFTPILHIRFHIGFGPLLVLLVMVTIYSLRDILAAIRALIEGEA